MPRQYEIPKTCLDDSLRMGGKFRQALDATQMHQAMAVDSATGSQMRVGVFRAVFIFMLFMSHLAASNCCALAAYTWSSAFCPDHCQSIAGDEKTEDGKEKQTGDRCVSCPSQDMKKAVLPDDVSPQPALPPVLVLHVCLYFALIWQESEPELLPKVEERLESSEKRWHFITRASGWSRAPSGQVA